VTDKGWVTYRESALIISDSSMHRVQATASSRNETEILLRQTNAQLEDP
jgi:hypothetical protein